MKPSLAPGLMVLAVLAGLLTGHSVAPLLAPQPTLQPAAPNDNAIRVELKIYKNGELVYYDPDDPATANFLRVISMFFKIIPYYVQLRNGTWFAFESSSVFLSSFGKTIIAVSDGSSPFSRTMIDLPWTKKIYAYVDDAQITLDSIETILTIIGTISINTVMNITYTGLFIEYAEGDPYTTSGDEILVFADPLSKPIQANVGDLIIVVYRIVAP